MIFKIIITWFISIIILSKPTIAKDEIDSLSGVKNFAEIHIVDK